jgi:hypothetical protein
LTSQRLGGVNFFFITGLTGSSLVDLQNDSHRLRVDDKSAMDSQSTTSDVSLSSTMFLLIDYIFSLSILLEIIIHHLLFRVCGHMILDVITFIVK